MKDFNVKYQGNDFKEWYKANYGSDYDPNKGFSRTEGMSDVDWSIGNNLYNSFLTGNNLENNYNNSVSELEKNYGQSINSLNTSKKNSQQTASITLDKLKKYLPTQIKAQGLGGLGISQSSMLQAYNNYNNAMGEIEGSYNANKSVLDASKNSTLSELERAYQDNKTNIGINAGKESQNIFDKYLNEHNQKQDSLYNEILNSIQKGGYTSEQDILSYIDEFGSNLSSDRINTLKQNAKGLAAENLKAYQDENFNKVFDYWANSSYADASALESYVNQFKGKVSDENWATIEQWVKDVKESPEEQERQNALEEQKKLDEFNSVTTGDVSFNNDGGWWIFGSTDMGEKGNNFSVKDKDGFIYRIQSGGEVADGNIVNAAKDVGNKQVFGYAGKLYYKDGGKVYLVEKRDSTFQTHYDKLYNKYFPQK